MISASLIKTFAKQADTSILYVEKCINEIKDELAEQDITEDTARFYPYLIIKLKKKLKITESSSVIKRFKNFINK